MFSIAPIVEGHGEVDAAGVLIRNFFHDVPVQWKCHKPIRAPKGSLLAGFDAPRRRGIEYYVRLATDIHGPRLDAVLVVLDADATCIHRERERRAPLGPWLEERARGVCGDTLARVVVANREYEAWFLNAWRCMFPESRTALCLDVESIGDCKGRVGQLWGRKYKPTLHQAGLTNLLPFAPELGETSRSFRRLMEVLQELKSLAVERQGKIG